ncbi:GMP synthase - Glutamine amidotransferase domain-like protein [Thioalkalivibrio nitratireducens DSM 14787]|uniref:GMP synthase-Glutamine amidotransferase domain-like protein n=1 Tax=Thioalkalivibrio nitratireducens (strain DSM 14787 / UNIQEM 213 / ALEN2) TaxID=1255043 RepID=L0E1C2_THIND|nr:glutamine amidotransferase [Thioalkalivibrio nitratireducens]AGA35047.1 GMP synthase - Glutamine amidotransferase domain-like protein [Thioalkalivibrio nitratireducens DSM 14787]
MKNYCVVQHTYSEFLGLIESHLEKRDIGFSYYRPFVGQGLPGSAAQFDGLWLLGGAWPVTDLEHNPQVPDELALIDVFRRSRRPVIGLGMGGLLVALQAGGTAHAEPPCRAEFVTVRRTDAGAGDALAEALDGKHVPVLVHGRVDLPEGLEPILVDDTGRWLAVRPDALTYGLLFRPEMKPGMLEDIIMEAGHNPPPNIGELLTEARLEWRGMQDATSRVVVALVTELELMQERRKMPVFSLKLETDA